MIKVFHRMAGRVQRSTSVCSAVRAINRDAIKDHECSAHRTQQRQSSSLSVGYEDLGRTRPHSGFEIHRLVIGD